MKTAVVLGTRPEIIKMSPVIRELGRRQQNYFILHTGQHYSYNLDTVFFEQLKLPQSKYNLEVGSGSHAEQTGKILVGVEKVLLDENPDIVLVEGDTNSVLAGALAATKLHIKVGHVEAGLRSYDRSMPEEINRILTDHCSDYLFASTEKAKTILLGEGVPENKIFVTGSTIVDALFQNLEIAKRNSDFEPGTLNLEPRNYLLATLHRQENVDNKRRFASILEGFERVVNEFRLPIIYPIHPRSRKMIGQFGLQPKNLNLIEPLSFLSFLQLENNARLILTDSGGVQQEACVMRVPCVTLRDNTEWVETLEVGSNILAGSSADKIVSCTRLMLDNQSNWSNPFGDGKAGQRTVATVLQGRASQSTP
jgi:UDP-N-acetylglucosamine 2-epimerase (non-hydrolysing)